MIKEKLYIWVCDYSENSGEGKLARLFIKKLNINNNYKIIFNQEKKMLYKYISTFFGILYCWKKYLNNQKVCYLNYLPLWNFFLFIFLPPKTILGPITGGANYKKSNNFQYYVRSMIFPLLYKISEFFLNHRTSKIIFSTDLLKKKLFQKTIKKSQFNFVYENFFYRKKILKKIDFLIYYRKHKNKETFFPLDFIKKLIKNKFKIHIIGDKLNLPNLKNHGFISSKKVSKLQSLAKYTVVSGENLFSFFIIECLSNNMKVIVEKKDKLIIQVHKQKFIKLNFNNKKDFKKIKKI